MNDPLGLIAPLLLLLGGKALAMGIAGAGAYGSAWVADKIKGLREGKQSTTARDAIKTVAPEVRDIAISSIVPAVAPAAVLPAMQAGTTISGAYTAMGQRIGAAMETVATGASLKGMEFLQGYGIPGPPSTSSISEMFGSGSSYVIEKYKQRFK